MKIEDVVKVLEERDVWIAGSIVALNVDEKDWYYTGCGSCGKKVDKVPQGRYECNQAITQGLTSNSSTRLRRWSMIALHAWLFFCGSFFVPLCGKEADEVVKEDTEELGYSPTLDNLIEKRALFKMKVRVNNYKKADKVYAVDIVCEDDDLIKKHLPEEPNDQPNQNDVEIGSSNSLDSSHVVANAQADNVDQSSLGVGEDSVSANTPLKILSPNKVGAESAGTKAELDGQYSTNKFSRKGSKKSKFLIIDDGN
ncbi:hypothetical protein PIB30_099058 [Stylosanthes scabra]|uniref:Replication factor A C-terminal domain-containing protein n=1 Tax=Stylosanthes scabra TaxID=79078 RepID=A0ABU6YY63_9FABA|nr:hypothetical protein [Stylosanthes scabra]